MKTSSVLDFNKRHKIKILIVDDHQMVRDGIRTMLESKADSYHFTIIESESGEDALVRVQKMKFDIILMDYQLPKMNGAETICKLLKLNPQTKILAVSNYDEFTYIKKVMDSGAKGYILKNIGPSELITAIETVLNGELYYTKDVAMKIIQNKSFSNDKVEINNSPLSNRETEVLKLIVNEQSNDEIANELNITKRTVDSHRQNLLKKIGVKNTVGLVKYAYDLNLI